MTTFDWNLFWNGFGAIGSTIGSVATAFAVFVAIKQLKQPKSKKVIIKFFMKEDVPLDDFPLLHVLIINDCLSSIFIESIGYKIHGKYIQLLNRSINHKIYKLPHTLKSDNYLDVEFDYDTLCETLKKENKYDKICFICEDSLKNTYKSKNITIEDFLDLCDETMDYSDVYLDP